MSHYDDLAGAIISDYIIPNHYKIGSSVDDFNFGVLDFDWGETKESSKITVGIHDINDVTRLETTVEYSELKFDDSINDDKCEQSFNSRYKPLKEYIAYYAHHKSVLLFYLGLIYSVYNILRFLYFILKLFFRLFRRNAKQKQD